MSTVTIPMQVPEAMAPYIEAASPNQVFERNAMILYPYIQNLLISHGRAAEILGVHEFDLIDFYGTLGLPYLNQSIDDLEEELADMRGLEGARE